MHATPLRYLDGSMVRVSRPDGAASLRIHIDGEEAVLAGRVRRVFPLSNPEALISLQDIEGKELGLINPADLDPTSQKTITEELDRTYFTPVISRIASLKQEGGMWTWQVETSRGDATFYVRSWRDSSSEIQTGRWQIQSVDGQRYEIRDFEALDDRSKQFIEQLF